MKTLRQALEKEVQRTGVHMFKVVREGYSGVFSYTPPMYDKRIVYSLEDMDKLTEEGFFINIDETNVAMLLFNTMGNN